MPRFYWVRAAKGGDPNVSAFPDSSLRSPASYSRHGGSGESLS
jgi:hypothetical protein